MNIFVKLLLLFFFIFYTIASTVLAETPEEKGLRIAEEADLDGQGFQDTVSQMEMTLRNAQGEESVRKFYSKTLELENCIICYKKSNILTKCNHSFCLKCLCKWYINCKYSRESCPYCRNLLRLTYCIYKPHILKK